VAQHGGSCEEMVDGTVATLFAGAAAADVAVRAARCLLDARLRGPVALASGALGPFPDGLAGVIERGGMLLHGARLTSIFETHRSTRAIRLCADSARLLARDFEIVNNGAGAWLVGEGAA